MSGGAKPFTEEQEARIREIVRESRGALRLLGSDGPEEPAGYVADRLRDASDVLQRVSIGGFAQRVQPNDR